MHGKRARGFLEHLVDLLPLVIAVLLLVLFLLYWS